MDQHTSQTSFPKILIADDDPCVLRAVAERCNGMGFEVETASSGLQALIKASECHPDLIVIDVHMPEVDGLSVLSMLVEVAKTSRHVIVMTGHPGQEIVESCSWFDAACVRKGVNFWTEFEDRLIQIYPERRADIRPQDSTGPQAAADVNAHPRVLLIDDDFSVRKFYFHKFAKLGAELLFAADGTRGFWMARRQEPTVIIADYWMPHGDAEYLLTRLRGAPETSTIPVVVQSGRPLSYAIKQRLQKDIFGHPGATRVLRKSADVGELFDVLQRLCGFSSNLEGAALYQ
jgi:CheY-like chemotaxis protein